MSFRPYAFIFTALACGGLAVLLLWVPEPIKSVTPVRRESETKPVNHTQRSSGDSVEITKTVSSRRPYSRLNSLSATTLSNKAPVAEGSTPVDKRLERFMNHRGRDAASLLAAYKASGDYSLLVEARNRFPTYPAVLAELSLGRFTYPAKFSEAANPAAELGPISIVRLYSTVS
jgi:hypothetical protein